MTQLSVEDKNRGGKQLGKTVTVKGNFQTINILRNVRKDVVSTKQNQCKQVQPQNLKDLRGKF